MSDETMSCAEMGQAMMHTDVVQMIGNEIGAGITVFGPGKGVFGIAENAEKGEIAAQLFPDLVGAVTYLGCLPAEMGSEGGAAIGHSLHNLGATIHDFVSPPAPSGPTIDTWSSLASLDAGSASHGEHNASISGAQSGHADAGSGGHGGHDGAQGGGEM